MGGPGLGAARGLWKASRYRISRITRPRPRKNADGLSAFSLIDPAGNWIRFFGRKRVQLDSTATSRLGEALHNAVVLADSKGDLAQASKILSGAPGSLKGLQCVVKDAAQARESLLAVRVEVSELDDQPWGTFVYFSDPDGNGWALQQLPEWAPNYAG